MTGRKIPTSDVQILIVDDSLQYSQVLKKVLEGGFGYKKITAVDSTDTAYDMIEKEPDKFKIIFVDYNFPNGKTGGDLLEKLKEGKFLDDKVAFLITSDPNVDNMRQAKAAGALAVVAKPFDREELRTQLERADMLINEEDSW